jgi:hypothetical protein
MSKFDPAKLCRDRSKALGIILSIRKFVEDREIYFELAEIDYLLTGAELFIDIDPNGQTFYLIELFLTFPGEKASRECNIMIDPDKLYDLVVKKEINEKDDKEKQK